MIQMEHKLKLIEHIINGGSIEYNGEQFSPDSLLVDDDRIISFDELDDCKIYLSNKDKHILELEEIVNSLGKQVQLLSKQKRKVAQNAREQQESIDSKSTRIKSPYRKHLTNEEIREIEKIFTHDFRTKAGIVITSYGISEPVASKIRLGKHGKSSSTYIAHLKAIGQWQQTK